MTLLGAGHYHQGAGIHPKEVEIPPYYVRVELMTGGRGWIKSGETWREVLPGDLIWNEPGDQTIGRSDFENPYRCLSVTFRTPHKKGCGMPRLTKAPSPEEALSFTLEVTQPFFDGTFDRQILRDYIASRVLFWIQLHIHRTKNPLLPAPLQAALSWMEKHFASSCPIQALARQVGWSVPHLHETFRHHLSSTPHKILMGHRLRAAQMRLVSTAQPIKQIAIECGFTNASAFTHFFKANIGSTPLTYRNRHGRLKIKT